MMNIFSVSYLYVFIGEVSVHIFCPFFDVIICFVCVEFEKFFIDPGYQPFGKIVESTPKKQIIQSRNGQKS